MVDVNYRYIYLVDNITDLFELFMLITDTLPWLKI